jgi:hypothetical protein
VNELARLRGRERWIAWVRLLGIPFAVVEVGVVSRGYPPRYEVWAWVVTAVGLSSDSGTGTTFTVRLPIA